MSNNKLLRGSVTKHYIKFLVPTMLSNFSVAAFAFVDMLFVGQGVGPAGLAALSLALPFVIVGGVVSLLLGIGGSTIFGIESGRQNPKAKTQILTVCLTVGVGFGLVFAAVGIPLIDQLTRLTGTSEELFPYVRSYLLPFTATQSIYIANQLLGFFVRTDGNPRLVMWATIGNNAFNILFDYIFIFPMQMGIFGASLATSLAPLVGITIMTLHFRQDSGGTIKLKFSKEMFSWLPRICKNGFGSCVGELASAIQIFLYNNTLLRLGGALAVSAYSVIGNISFIVFAMSNSVGLASQPIISNNFGAGIRDRVKKTIRVAYITAISFGLLVFAIMQLFPGPIFSLFTQPEEVELIAMGIYGTRIYAFAFLLMPISLATVSIMQSLESSLAANVLSLSKGFVFMLLGITVLPLLFGVNGVWATSPFVEVCTLIYVLTIGVWTLRKKLRKIGEKRDDSPPPKASEPQPE